MVKSTTRDMTKGSPWKLIAGFALPVLLSQIFQQLYNTADTLIVGRFLGDEALAAVSSSGPLIFLLISFFEGLTMGASVTISRYFGADDKERVQRAIHTNILVSTMSGLFLTGFGIIMTPHILGWMGTDPEVLPDAIAYFRYYFMGILSVVLYNACKSIMNALGDSRRPLYYLLLSSLTNIVLDVLFIGVFHWGVWSAAFATTISQTISMVLCMIHLSSKNTAFHIQWKNLRIDREMLGQIVRYGLPSGVQNSVIGLANVIVQTNINSFGKIAMAAYGTYAKLEGFAFLPITSFTMALTTYTSQNLGACEYERAKRRALRHNLRNDIGGADRRCNVYIHAQACRTVQQHAGGNSLRYQAGAYDSAVLLPAGLFPRGGVRMPWRGQGVRANDNNARRLVCAAHNLYNHSHAHIARYTACVLRLSAHLVNKLGNILPVLSFLQLGAWL